MNPPLFVPLRIRRHLSSTRRLPFNRMFECAPIVNINPVLEDFAASYDSYTLHKTSITKPLKIGFAALRIFHKWGVDLPADYEEHLRRLIDSGDECALARSGGFDFWVDVANNTISSFDRNFLDELHIRLQPVEARPEDFCKRGMFKHPKVCDGFRNRNVPPSD